MSASGLWWRVFPLWMLCAATPLLAVDHTLLRADRSAVVEMRVAALIMSGQQGGALPIAVTALPRLADPSGVTALAEIDGAALLANRSGPGSQTVEVFAYVLGGELEVLDQRSLQVDIGPRHDQLLVSTGLKVFLPLTIPPGDHQLRVLVRTGDAFGLRGHELARPQPEGQLRILPPIFHEIDEPWLLAVPAEVDLALPPPFGLAAGSPLPTARPLLSPGEEAVAQVFVVGDREAARLTLLLRQLGGEGAEVPFEIVERVESALGLETVGVSFTGQGLASGPYEIALALMPETVMPETEVPETTDEPAPEAAALARSSYVPILVQSGAATVPVEPGEPSVADVSPPAEPLTKGEKKLLRQATAGYVRALSQLAAGQRRAALATLRHSETRVAEALDGDPRSILEPAGSEVLSQLPVADWGCALPIALLHLDLSREYRDERRFILAGHAVEMAVTLAETYALKLATPRARREAAGVISSLAGYAQSSGALGRAERLFGQALVVAGNDEAALLGLAGILEKRGLFAEAVPALEGLLGSRPDHREGQLRLALNRYRLGDVVAARRGLRRLTTQDQAEWIALLAHQELARLEVDQGRLAQAASVLRRGLGLWPSHPTLTLQLAYVLEAQGEAPAARELLESLDLSAATYSASERTRYNSWSAGLLDASRRALGEVAAGRLGALGRWLESLPAAGEG